MSLQNARNRKRKQLPSLYEFTSTVKRNALQFIMITDSWLFIQKQDPLLFEKQKEWYDEVERNLKKYNGDTVVAILNVSQ